MSIRLFRRHPEKKRTASQAESGLSLMEILVAIVLLGIMASAGISNLIVALRTAKYTEVNFAANSLAISKVEEISAIDVSALNASYNETEPDVPWSDLNLTFTRTTTISVNDDDSRTIDVSVVSNSPDVTTDVSFSTTLALWE